MQQATGLQRIDIKPYSKPQRCMMVKTPDSVPSLAELSRASTEAEDVSRVLFQTPDDEKMEVLLGYSHSLSEEDKDPLFGSDISIASEGDNSIVNSDNESSYAGQRDMPSPLTPCVSNRREANDDPIETYCHTGFTLSPKELAGMFNIFNDSQKSDSLIDIYSPISTAADSGTDAVTEVTSNIDHSTISWERKIDSLERECSTLKEIIKSDSVKILQLKTEIENQHVQSESLSQNRPEPGASALKRERETLLKREAQHVESIKLLKQEIKNLREARTDATLNKELEQLRLENELLAAQIVENETELFAARSTAKELADENATMKQQLALQEKTNPAAVDKSLHDNEMAILKPSTEMLEAQIASLAAKIAEIEADRERRDRELEEENRQTHDDLESIKAMIQPSFSYEETPSKDSFVASVEDVNIHKFNDEVEVTLEGMLIARSSSPREDAVSTSDKDKAEELEDEPSGFCDCLSILSTKDKE